MVYALVSVCLSNVWKKMCWYAPASVVLSTCSALLMHNWLCCRPSKPDAG